MDLSAPFLAFTHKTPQSLQLAFRARLDPLFSENFTLLTANSTMASNGSPDVRDASASYLEALSTLSPADREAQVQALQERAAQQARQEAITAAAEQQAQREAEAEAQAQTEREAAAREAAEHAALEEAQAELQRQRAASEAAAAQRAHAESVARGLQHRRLEQAAHGAGERALEREPAVRETATSQAGLRLATRGTVQELQDSPDFEKLVRQLVQEGLQAQQQPASGKRFAAAVSALSRRPFEEKSNRLETWLWQAELLLQKTGLDRESWGLALIQALTDGPSEAVRVQLHSTSDPTLLSYEAVVGVLTSLYGVKETASGLQTKLEQLQLTTDSLAAFLVYRDKFTNLCSRIPETDLAAPQRCRIFLLGCPHWLRMALTLGREQANDLAQLIHLAGQAMQSLEESRLQQRSAAAEPAVGRGKGRAQPHADSARPAKVGKTTHNGGPSSSGAGSNRPPPVVDGVPAAVVLERLTARVCLKCGQSGHRARECANGPNAARQRTFCPPPIVAAMLDSHLQKHDASIKGGLPSLPYSSLKALEVRTQPFTSMVGCACDEFPGSKLNFDMFLSSMHEGHVLLDLSSAKPHEARNVILHAQNCRKERSLGIVYLLPKMKDSAWKALLTNAAGLTSVYPCLKQNGKSTKAHALYEAPMVAGLSTIWSCNVAGGEGPRPL